MQLIFRRNPKTVGWARRVAIALLVGSGALLITLPLSFFLFLNHYQAVYPKDTQNLLSALTASVLVGFAVAGISTATSLILSAIPHLRRHVPIPPI